jgi:circadian clock protein KaiC
MLPTGVDGLDDILGGGYAEAHIHLIEGQPGAGKTTLALQFLRDGNTRGERGLYITLSESRIELLAAAATPGRSTASRFTSSCHPNSALIPRKSKA